MTTLEKIRSEIAEIAPLDYPCDKRTPERIRDMALEIIDKYAEQEPCDDVVSRQAVLDLLVKYDNDMEFDVYSEIFDSIDKLPSVRPKEQTGHCKECKYFEYDSVAKVDGVPLIVAHEICSKWGDGCKTKEDGFCFMFEESEDKGMNEIKCPHDLNQFLLGEPMFENPFPEEECKQRKFYGDCYHCFSTAIASRDHQLKNTINKIREIVDEWKSDTWTDNLSYECMVKIVELLEQQEGAIRHEVN